MKFVSIMLAMVMGVSVAQAEVLADVSVGATTNKVYRGDTISERGTSAGIVGKLTHAETGLYAQYTGDTVKVAPRAATLRHEVEGGIGHSFGEVALAGGYRYTAWTGGSARGTVSDLDTGEVFVGASAYGFSAEYAKVVKADKITNSKDDFLHVGYAYTFDALPVTLSAGALQTGYNTAGVRRWGYDAGASYKATKNLSFGATYTRAGKDAAGLTRQNQVSASVNYAL